MAHRVYGLLKDWLDSITSILRYIWTFRPRTGKIKSLTEKAKLENLVKVHYELRYIARSENLKCSQIAVKL
jgi:hypothetical protein